MNMCLITITSLERDEPDRAKFYMLVKEESVDLPLFFLLINVCV